MAQSRHRERQLLLCHNTSFWTRDGGDGDGCCLGRIENWLRRKTEWVGYGADLSLLVDLLCAYTSRLDTCLLSRSSLGMRRGSAGWEGRKRPSSTESARKLFSLVCNIFILNCFYRCQTISLWLKNTYVHCWSIPRVMSANLNLLATLDCQVYEISARSSVRSCFQI